MRDDKGPQALSRPLALSVIVIGLLALGIILRTAEAILAPMTLALVTGVILSPIAVSWERIGIPSRIGALLNLTLALIAIGGAVFLLQPVAWRLAEQAPKVVADVEDTVRELRASFRGLSEMSENVADVIKLEENTDPDPQPKPEAPPAEEPKPEIPTVADALWLAPSILAKIAVFAGTLFFFIATRMDIYRWLSRHLPWRDTSENIQSKLMEAERRVSHYFLTISIINAGLGCAVFIVTQQIGVPGAAVWGLLAFLANFVLYLGPVCFAAALLYAGVATFDGAMTLLPTASYLALNFIEAQFVTPSTVGRQLNLNPLVVFVSVVFGIWMWGPIGGIVAIPILVWLIVVNDARRKPMEPS